MANRDYDRDRRWRERDYGRDRSFFDRNFYDRDYFDRDFSGRRYTDRDYYNERRYSPYGRDYESDYDYEYSDYEYDNWGSGPYFGVGPQNYRRSDERILDDVNDRLTWHGHINASEIEVSVNDGVVTLRGTVDSRRERRMAEEVAENVMGVWDVNNEISLRNIGRRGSGERWQTREGQTREGQRHEGQMREGQTRQGQMQTGQIREGMDVVGRDNDQVGQVKKVRTNDFLVDRPMARDVYVPFTAANMEGGRIRLHVRAGDVDSQGWEMPEIIETS